MPEPHEAAVPALGVRIRAERLRRGMTVRGLARDIGVSASLISQIETGKSQPSVGTLYAITNALGLSVEDLFGPGAPADGAVPDGAADEDGTGDTRDTGGADNGIEDPLRPADQGGSELHGPVVHPPGRELLTLDSGVTWERLGQLPDAHFDFLLITYAPGGTSSSNGDLMRHRGTEYGYLVSGELVLTLGSEDHRLVAGDAVCFDSSMPHRLHNDADEPAVGVWFVRERG